MKTKLQSPILKSQFILTKLQFDFNMTNIKIAVQCIAFQYMVDAAENDSQLINAQTDPKEES